MLRQLSQLLLPGSSLVVNEPLLPAGSEWFPMLLMRLDRGKHFRHLPTLHAMMREAGFMVEAEEPYRESLVGVRGSHMIAIRYCLTGLR